MQVDDIVLLKDENLPRSKWLLGCVTDFSPGDDGKVRKVQVAIWDSNADREGKRTRPLSKLQRPIHKLVLLYGSNEPKEDREPPLRSQ